LFAYKDSGFVTAVVFLVAWLAYLLIRQPGETILVPDSLGYLNFSPVRTSGYPLFLWLVGQEAVKVVQPMLAAFALLVLYCESRKLFHSAAVAFAVIVAVATNFRFYQYHYTVFTESLYSTLLTLIVAAFIRYARRPGDKKSLALLSLLCGIAVAVRPTAAYLLPAILLGMVLVWNRGAAGRFRLLLVCVTPFLIVVGAEKVFHSAWHDGRSASLFTRHAFAKAALIDAAADRSGNAYDKALQDGFRSAREFIWSAPGFYVRNHFLKHYEVCIQYSCSEKEDLDLDSEQARVSAINRLRSNVSGYIALTWHNYRSLWTVYPTAAPGAAQKINHYLEKTRPIPHRQHLDWLEEAVPERGWVAYAVQVFVLMVGVLSLCVIATGCRRWIQRKELDAVFATTFFASLCLQGSQMLTALAGASMIRYTIALWPLFIVCLAGTAVLLFKARGADRGDHPDRTT
jgi:4-amino-4-deoxy-L-arabinose transferase-like glycosyltransferase